MRAVQRRVISILQFHGITLSAPPDCPCIFTRNLRLAPPDWIKLTSASRWRADALLQCRCSDIGAMHRDATGQCGLVILLGF